MQKLTRFIKVVLSYLIAILRLLFWVVLVFVYGLHKTLFTGTEITSVELRGLPLRCDLEGIHDNMAYIDKMIIEHPDLMNVPEEYPMNEEEMDIHDEDDDDFGDDGNDQFPKE